MILDSRNIVKELCLMDIFRLKEMAKGKEKMKKMKKKKMIQL